MKKPIDLTEYKKWLRDKFSLTINSKHENHYQSIATKIQKDYSESEVWQNVMKNLPEINNLYLAKTNYPLLNLEKKPELVTKPFNSFFEKTFRKNVIYNKNWPNPPQEGWIIPENWIEKTNDILRTCFIVRYLDGVEFIIEHLKEIFKKDNINCNCFFEAREEGYYAAHLYTHFNFEIPKIDWDTETKFISIEIQVTTQLQDVIGKLTHQFYEERRLKQVKSDIKWQWNYESEEFTANYLGHILHYVEGMIVDVRNKQLKNKL